MVNEVLKVRKNHKNFENLANPVELCVMLSTPNH